MSKKIVLNFNDPEFWDAIWNSIPDTWTHQLNLDIAEVTSILQAHGYSWNTEEELKEFLTDLLVIINKQGLVETGILSEDTFLFRRCNRRPSSDPAYIKQLKEAIEKQLSK
jgi:hypothetical protein